MYPVNSILNWTTQLDYPAHGVWYGNVAVWYGSVAITFTCGHNFYSTRLPINWTTQLDYSSTRLPCSWGVARHCGRNMAINFAYGDGTLSLKFDVNCPVI